MHALTCNRQSQCMRCWRMARSTLTQPVLPPPHLTPPSLAKDPTSLIVSSVV